MRVRCCHCQNVFDNRKTTDNGKDFCSKECKDAKAYLAKWAAGQPRTVSDKAKRNFIYSQVCARSYTYFEKRLSVMRG